MGTYLVLSRTPLQPVLLLCEEEHGAEQVRIEQPGQVYLASCSLHIAQMGLGGAVEDDTSGCSASYANDACDWGFGGREGWVYIEEAAIRNVEVS